MINNTIVKIIINISEEEYLGGLYSIGICEYFELCFKTVLNLVK